MDRVVSDLDRRAALHACSDSTGHGVRTPDLRTVPGEQIKLDMGTKEEHIPTNRRREPGRRVLCTLYTSNH